MSEMITGDLRVDASQRFAIVVSRFNEFITRQLLAGAVDCLQRHGGSPEQITQVQVPGSFELPLVAHKLAATGKFDAIIALGAIIRGQTPHFEYVAAEAAKGIAHASLTTGVPVSFGVITADNVEQAVDRAGTKSGNKGADAALTAIEMANLLGKLKSIG